MHANIKGRRDSNISDIWGSLGACAQIYEAGRTGSAPSPAFSEGSTRDWLSVRWITAGTSSFSTIFAHSWESAPVYEVDCPVFLNAGSSLNQSLLYFPPSLRPNIFSSVVAFCTIQHIYICPSIPHTILSNPNARPCSRSFFLCSCTLSPHVMALVLTRVCFDRSFLGSRKKISAPGKTHKTPPPLFILFWTDNEV